MSRATSGGLQLSCAVIWMGIAVIHGQSGNGFLVLASAGLSVSHCFLAAHTLTTKADD